jgi:hypothetical protein
LEEVALREEVQVCAGVLRFNRYVEPVDCDVVVNHIRCHIVMMHAGGWRENQTSLEVLEAIWTEPAGPWLLDGTPLIVPVVEVIVDKLLYGHVDAGGAVKRNHAGKL